MRVFNYLSMMNELESPLSPATHCTDKLGTVMVCSAVTPNGFHSQSPMDRLRAKAIAWRCVLEYVYDARLTGSQPVTERATDVASVNPRHSASVKDVTEMRIERTELTMATKYLFHEG